MAVGFEDIEAAAQTLAGQVVRTPCLRSERLSELLGCDITLKFETFQHSSSFKDRGAYVKLASLSEEERARGVIAMSAGNHAQGVAYHATRLGIPATIVMPKLTPFVKVEKTTQFGARVLLEGDSVDEAADYAHRLAAERNLTFIHPYDDPLIIAGQGTIGLEMLTDAPELDALVVPIGGGGLISGVAIAAKALKPEVEIVGVQAAACPSMYRRRAGLPEAPLRPTIAEGIAVKNPGELTLPIVRRAGRRHPAGRGGRDRGCDPRPCSRSRRWWSRAPARSGSPRSSPIASASSAGASAWCCAAATSICACCPW